MQSPDEAAATAARRVGELIEAAVADTGHCSLALAGGTTPKALYERLPAEGLPWHRVALYLGDERAVPVDHPESNLGMAREALIDRLRGVQVYPMVTDPAEPERDAERYAALLANGLPRSPAGLPVLDIVLLGLGADGHTASLFPGSRALEVVDRTVVAESVPNKGWRITMTRPVLDVARHRLVLATGAGKAAAVAAAIGRAHDVALPINRLTRPLEWYLDQAAARDIDPAATR